MRKAAGFTLVELMTAIAILALVMMIGVGSFREVTRHSRLRAQNNKVVGAFALARSEAVKRSRPVSVCPSANGADCDGSNDWAGDVIVFVDRETPGAVDADDELVQTFDAASPGVTVDSSVEFVQYQGSGLTNLAETATVDIYNEGCSGPQARRVSVTVAGRTASTVVECP
jgi:type IV fimbrial biogenesis protein FimT